MLSKSATGPLLGETLSVSTVSAAIAALHGFAAFVEQCPVYTTDVGGISATITLAPVQIDPIADGTAAFQMDTTVPMATVRGIVIVVRCGRLLVTIVDTPVSGPPDPAKSRQLAGNAVDKARSLC